MRDSEYHPTFPFLKRFQAIKYSFVAIKIPLSNKIGETCECVNFSRQMDAKRFIEICRYLKIL